MHNFIVAQFLWGDGIRFGINPHQVPQREISVIGSRVFLSTAFLIRNTNNLHIQCNSPRLARNADSKRRLVVLARQEDIHVIDVKNQGESFTPLRH
jgi:hypothetical protein